VEIPVALLLEDFLPAPDLRDIVRLYRIVHFKFGNTGDLPTKPYSPRPEHCLAFYPFDTERVQYADSGQTFSALRVVLSGQQLMVTQRKVGCNFFIFQIVFQPTGLYRVTGIPANYFTNQYLSAEDIFSTSVTLYNEQFYHAKSYSQTLQIADAFVRQELIGRMKQFRKVDLIANLILHQPNESLDYLAKEACLSIKQFQRVFDERVGVSPKLYSRVCRFDRAFMMKLKNPDLDWLSIAVACGYYDYQHLVRDYKQFTLQTPNGFHQLEEKAPERLLGLSEAFYEHNLR
jgi:AraC-like DNA-binding protein